LQAITGFTFAIGNNETWSFDFQVTGTNSNSTGCAFGIRVSAGAPTLEAMVYGSGSASTFVSGRLTATNTTAGTLLAAAATGIVHISGIIAATASGACNVTLGVQPGTGSTITVVSNSKVIAMRST
jgi:hypothetical protein